MDSEVEMELDMINACLRAVLQSEREFIEKGLRSKTLAWEYKKEEGRLDYKKFGCKTFYQFLTEKCRGSCRVRLDMGNEDDFLVFPVSDQNTRHIEEMQRKTKKKKKKKAGMKKTFMVKTKKYASYSRSYQPTSTVRTTAKTWQPPVKSKLKMTNCSWQVYGAHVHGILLDRKSGMMSSDVEREYEKRRFEGLPPDWIDQLEDRFLQICKDFGDEMYLVKILPDKTEQTTRPQHASANSSLLASSSSLSAATGKFSTTSSVSVSTATGKFSTTSSWSVSTAPARFTKTANLPVSTAPARYPTTPSVPESAILGSSSRTSRVSVSAAPLRYPATPGVPVSAVLGRTSSVSSAASGRYSTAPSVPVSAGLGSSSRTSSVSISATSLGRISTPCGVSVSAATGRISTPGRYPNTPIVSVSAAPVRSSSLNISTPAMSASGIRVRLPIAPSLPTQVRSVRQPKPVRSLRPRTPPKSVVQLIRPTIPVGNPSTNSCKPIFSMTSSLVRNVIPSTTTKSSNFVSKPVFSMISAPSGYDRIPSTRHLVDQPLSQQAYKDAIHLKSSTSVRQTEKVSDEILLDDSTEIIEILDESDSGSDDRDNNNPTDIDVNANINIRRESAPRKPASRSKLRPSIVLYHHPNSKNHVPLSVNKRDKDKENQSAHQSKELKKPVLDAELAENEKQDKSYNTNTTNDRGDAEIFYSDAESESSEEIQIVECTCNSTATPAFCLTCTAIFPRDNLTCQAHPEKRLCLFCLSTEVIQLKEAKY